MSTVLMLVVFCEDIARQTALELIRDTLPDVAVRNLQDRRQMLVITVPRDRARSFQETLSDRPEIAKCERLP